MDKYQLVKSEIQTRLMLIHGVEINIESLNISENLKCFQVNLMVWIEKPIYYVRLFYDHNLIDLRISDINIMLGKFNENFYILEKIKFYLDDIDCERLFERK